VVLSKRERYIAIATIATLGLVMFYVLAISPLLDRKLELADKIKKEEVTWDRVKAAEKYADGIKPMWNKRISGPLKKNALETESQLFDTVDKWAKEAGVTLSSLNRPDRNDKEKDFSKFTLRATAKSNLKQLGAFMYKIQTAEIPVRISELSINSPKSGTDELTITMGISTIFLSPEPDSKPGPVTSREGAP